MMFDCDRCAYSTTKKSDFIRHLSRKEPCIATICNVPIIDIKKKYQLIEPTKENDPSTHPFECLFCNRRYKYKYNKTKHLKTCALKKESESIQSELDQENPSLSNDILQEILCSLQSLHKRIDAIAEKRIPYTIHLHNSSAI